MRRLGVGASVTVILDGTRVAGQVWSLTDVEGYVWVALDNGQFVALHTLSGTAYKAPRSNERVGQVAA